MRLELLTLLLDVRRASWSRRVTAANQRWKPCSGSTWPTSGAIAIACHADTMQTISFCMAPFQMLK
jgi:hypothetical protein